MIPLFCNRSLVRSAEDINATCDANVLEVPSSAIAQAAPGPIGSPLFMPVD
jgi:hypothetical protein